MSRSLDSMCVMNVEKDRNGESTEGHKVKAIKAKIGNNSQKLVEVARSSSDER